MAGYTVIDFETTGLSPAHGDRIVEVGVVKVSHDGEIFDAWTTLVNPQRDVGASRIHGITARDVVRAPTFAQIAPHLLDSIAGRVLTAHNAAFDLRFLAAELQRAGYSLTNLPLQGVCTMSWASTYLGSSSRRLCDCCAAADINLDGAHTALGDALATAQLLARYLEWSSFRPAWQSTLAWSRSFRWPSYPAPSSTPPILTRSTSSAAQRPDGWLDRIVARLPHAAHPNVNSYLGVLEMAMLDGHLSLHEQDQLVAVAQECALSRQQVLAIHADYLTAMAQVAHADGIVTAEEKTDLNHAAACLGLTACDVDDALAAARSGNPPSTMLSVTGLTLDPGDRVVFTGEMAIDRSIWEQRARNVGLQPGGVTKSTKVVIAADPDSLSGKAAKARAYGIPIISEPTFAKLIAPLEQ